MSGLILFLTVFLGSAPVGSNEFNQIMNEADDRVASGDYEAASKMYQNVLDDEPDNVRALVSLARLYATAEDPKYYNGKLAVDFAVLALDRAPGNLAVIEVLAEGYFAQSQFERAVFELKKCIAACPRNQSYYKKLKRFGLTWKRRLEVDYPDQEIPLKAKVYFALGEAAYYLGKKDDALDLLKTAFDIDSELPGLLRLLSRVMIETHNADQAVEVLSDLGEEIGKDASLLHLLGLAFLDLGDHRIAMEKFRAARYLQPALKGLLTDMGKAYLLMDENVRAVMVLHEALEYVGRATFEERRERSTIHYYMGKAYTRAGEFDKALGALFQATAALDGEPRAEAELVAIIGKLRDGKGPVQCRIARSGIGNWPAPVFFADVTQKAGVDGEGSVSWGDFDNDGDPDLLVGSKRLFKNNGRNGFKEVSSDLGINRVKAAGGSLFADTDCDGDLDLFIFCNRSGFKDRLFVNQGKRGFEDATEQDGSPGDPLPTAAAAFGDLNGDGAVDLFLANCDEKSAGIASGTPNCLMINDGAGRFSAAAKEAGAALDNPRGASSAAIVDYDNDGDMDIFVVNRDLQPNTLWRNDTVEALRFCEIGAAARLAGSDHLGRYGDTRALVPGDVDGDGDLDFFLANAVPFIDRKRTDKSQVLLNSGRPEFVLVDTFSESGLCYDEYPQDAALGDVDNDGDLDLLIADSGEKGFLRVYVNGGKGSFHDATWLSGLTVPKAAGCALADYDRDGDLDVYVSGGGGKLFANSGNGNHWIGFVLEGDECNSTGISARVTIDAGGVSQVREVICGRGIFQDDMVLHFGLGPAKVRVNASIRWPNGKSAFLSNLKPDRYHTVKE